MGKEERRIKSKAALREKINGRLWCEIKKKKLNRIEMQKQGGKKM